MDPNNETKPEETKTETETKTGDQEKVTEGKPAETEKQVEGKTDDGKGQETDPTEKKTGMSEAEAELLKENMAKKKQLKELQEENATLKKQFEGIDPEAARTALGKIKEAETKELERKGEWDRLKEIMVKDHQTELDKITKERDELKAEISRRDTAIDDLTIGNGFGNSSYIKDNTILSPSKARVLFGNHFEIENGQIVGYDKPKGAADRTTLIDAKTGQNLSFDQAIEKIISADPDKDDLLKSNVKPGGGSKTEPVKVDTNMPKTTVEKIAAGLKNLK